MRVIDARASKISGKRDLEVRIVENTDVGRVGRAGQSDLAWIHGQISASQSASLNEALECVRVLARPTPRISCSGAFTYWLGQLRDQGGDSSAREVRDRAHSWKAFLRYVDEYAMVRCGAVKQGCARSNVESRSRSLSKMR